MGQECEHERKRADESLVLIDIPHVHIHELQDGDVRQLKAGPADLFCFKMKQHEEKMHLPELLYKKFNK